MNNLNCNVICDLLPLYIDEVCSPESRELVEAHLEECEACRKTLEQMRSSVEVECREGEESPKNALLYIKRKIKAKYIITALCAVIVCGGLFAGYSFMQLMERPMYYEEVNVKVVQDKKDPEQYNLMMDGPDYSGYYGGVITLREDKNHRYNEKVIHFTSSPWTRTFGKKFNENICIGGFRSGPDCVNPDSYTLNEDGSKQYDITVAVYYQATPGDERHLLWEADWYKEMIEKEKAAEKAKKE